MTKCSICGKTDHNKRTCPQRPIEDIRAMNDKTMNDKTMDDKTMDDKTMDDKTMDDKATEEYITEKVVISDKKELFMKDLEERESYEIHPQLFTMWLMSKRPIQLKELRYVYDKGFSRDSLQLYLDLVNMIEDYY